MIDSHEKSLEEGKNEQAVSVPSNDVEKNAASIENVTENNHDAAAKAADAVSSQADKDKTSAGTVAGDDNTGSSEAEHQKIYATKEEVLQRAKEIASSSETPQKAEVDHLKAVFYRLHNAQREAQQKEYLEKGGDPAKYQVLPDDTEEAFKAELQLIKDKRAKAFEQMAAERENNLKKKLEIIDKIKNMATSPDEANKSFQEFKELQQQWKEIGSVPPENNNEVWRNYQLYVEQFYDLLNLNREAREYDFKKNLEIKTHLCEEAEKLAGDDDVVDAFHKLQDLHQQYRETGPVEKDLREQLWTRFKAASTVINKRHQQHFEELRVKEEDNLKRKTELCEKVEAIAKEENKTNSDWEKHSKEIIAIQAEWKTIGFAPQKMNVKIFERFRTACDSFFGQKSEYYKKLKEQYSVNIDKKKNLVEQAQALTDSTDWKETAEKLIALQKEWKTIGRVPNKIGNQLWNDFLAACNHFFEARKAARGDSGSIEHQNLEKKNAVIAKLRELKEQAGENVQEQLKALVDEFNAIGHVPYKEKDKIYKEYHDVLDELYNNLKIKSARRKLDSFRSNIKKAAVKGEEALGGERSRLMHQYDQLKQEISTYENNLGFLNASSKKGNTLVDEMNRRVGRLKDNLKLVRDKIKAIDEENKNERNGGKNNNAGSAAEKSESAQPEASQQ